MANALPVLGFKLLLLKSKLTHVLAALLLACADASLLSVSADTWLYYTSWPRPASALWVQVLLPFQTAQPLV